MSANRKKIVIIGGGITGLSAAFYLEKEMKEKALPIDCTLIEASPRLGGKIQTIHKDGYVIERGPDSFLERKKSGTELAEQLGLGENLVNNATGQSYVLVDEKLHPIPEGAVMGIPTKLSPFIKTGLFSVFGKARASLDLILPASEAKGDRSLGEFFRRRVGDEVVENLIEPLLSGIYAGDIDKLSLMSTFPQFYQIEQRHRSLILGMKKGRQPVGPKPAKKKGGMFQTINTGLHTMVEAIENRLESTKIYKGTRAVQIEQQQGKYLIELDNGQQILADAAIVASPHKSISSLFGHKEELDYLKSMTSTSVANVALGFPDSTVEMEHEGTGFVISRNSDFAITACTWTNKKWPHTAPKGKTLLRAYVGKAGDESIVEQSDSEIVRIVLDDLKRIMKISGDPEMVSVTRWNESMPQYNVGHKQKMKEIRDTFSRSFPGIFMAGASFDGVGIPDCIDQGKLAVNEIIEYLTKAN